MTSPLRALSLLIAPVAPAALLAFAAPAAAVDSPGRAVDQCRAEMIAAFPADSIRSHRIGEIAGNSRRTRVTIYVNADRRYTLECTADREGRVTTATFDPPRAGGPQLASGRR